MSNVYRLLDKAVIEQPDAPAITHRRRGQDTTIVYGELQRNVSEEAIRFTNRGLEPGDRVLMLCPFGIELYISVLAAFRCGLTAMFVDPGAGLRRLNTCCELAQPKLIVATRRAWLMRPLVRALRWGTRWVQPSKLSSSTSLHADVANVGADHPALLTFTSGSTGEPKGVVRTHGFLNLQQQAIARELSLVAGECEVLTMPMFVLANLASGIHSVLGDVNLRRPEKDAAKKLASQVKTHNANRLLVSPSLVDQLADYCIDHSISLDSLNRVTTGGAPVFPRTIRKLAKAFPHSRTEVVYGSTEAEPIAVLDGSGQMQNHRERILNGKGLPAGRVTSDINVRILSSVFHPTTTCIDKNKFSVQCEPSECIGEIIVNGPRVLRSYLGNIGDDETKIHVEGDVWHRTGDLGRFDPDGCLWLLGRVTGRISDSRGPLEPMAVEAAAMEHESVQRCALVAIRGRRVLVVELTKNAAMTDASRQINQTDISRSLLDQLSWASLDQVLVISKLPLDRRHHSKIDYPSLRRLVGADSYRASETT